MTVEWPNTGVVVLKLKYCEAPGLEHLYISALRMARVGECDVVWTVESRAFSKDKEVVAVEMHWLVK